MSMTHSYSLTLSYHSTTRDAVAERQQQLLTSTDTSMSMYMYMNSLHVVSNDNTTKQLQQIRPRSRPRDTKQNYESSLPSRPPAPLHTCASPKIWRHYRTLWLFMRGSVRVRDASHTSAHEEWGAWGGRHPSWTCDSNGLGRDATYVYESPVLSMLNRGGGCFKRSP